MKKRVFAAMLALCMALSVLPTAALAAGEGEGATAVKLETPECSWAYKNYSRVYGDRDYWYIDTPTDENTTYSLKVYKKGDTDELIKEFEGNGRQLHALYSDNITGEYFVSLAEKSEDGDRYYCTLTALGDGVNTLDSDPAVSEVKTYKYAPAPKSARWVNGKETLDYNNGEGYYELYNWDMAYDNVKESEGEYYTIVYRKGDGEGEDEIFDSTRVSHDILDKSKELCVDWFRSHLNDTYKEFTSGTYYYTVSVDGDEEQGILDSKPTKSPDKVHVQPTAKLDIPTNLRWDGATARFDNVKGEHEGFNVDVRWSNNAGFVSGEMRHVFTGRSPRNELDITDDLDRYGEGYYRFRVATVTADPEKIINSDWSEWSPVYKTTGAETENDIKEIVDNLPANPTKDDISNAIQQVTELDRDALKAAMLTDYDNDRANGQLKAIEEKSGIIVDAEAKEGVELDTSKVSLVGAALNAAEDAEKVTFTVSKPERDAVISGAYKNTVQFDFKLNGGKAPEGQLDVPIKITMPVPQGINHNKLRILHFGADGRLSETISPHIYYADGTWMASFVVDHFSTFAFAEEAETEKPDTPGGGSGSSRPSISGNTQEKSTETKPTATFSDVEAGSWYESAVAFAVDKGLFKGVDENHFAPDTTTNRAMIMTVLARLDGQKADTYDEAVQWAISKGVSDGSDINAVITREQFATMLYRYAGQPQTKGQLTGFADIDDVSAWASHAMTWAVENGIVKGNEKSELSPLSGATRAEAAAIMQRYIELIEK